VLTALGLVDSLSATSRLADCHVLYMRSFERLLLSVRTIKPTVLQPTRDHVPPGWCEELDLRLLTNQRSLIGDTKM
jgi:hypothetical protein